MPRSLRLISFLQEICIDHSIGNLEPQPCQSWTLVLEPIKPFCGLVSLHVWTTRFYTRHQVCYASRNTRLPRCPPGHGHRRQASFFWYRYRTFYLHVDRRHMQHDMLGVIFWGSWSFLPGDKTITSHEFLTAGHDSQHNEFWTHLTHIIKPDKIPSLCFFHRRKKKWKEKEAE